MSPKRLRCAAVVLAWVMFVLSAGEAPAQLPDTLDLNRAVKIAVFQSAAAMDIDPSGKIFVADQGTDRIFRTSASADNVISWGGPGTNSQSFDGPSAILATNGLRILVADEGNGRVQWFTADGVYVGSVLIDGGSAVGRGQFEGVGRGSPIALASDTENEFYVIDAQTTSVLHWRNDRPLQQVVSGRSFSVPVMHEPVAVAVSGERIFVADRAAGNIVVFDRVGTYERTICNGQCSNLVSVRATSDYLIAISANGIRLYFSQGLLADSAFVVSDAPVIDAIPFSGSWYILTTRALYRMRL